MTKSTGYHQGSIPSTHTIQHRDSQSSVIPVPWDLTPSYGLLGYFMHVAHKQANNPHTENTDKSQKSGTLVGMLDITIAVTHSGCFLSLPLLGSTCCSRCCYIWPPNPPASTPQVLGFRHESPYLALNISFYFSVILGLSQHMLGGHSTLTVILGLPFSLVPVLEQGLPKLPD